MSGRGTTLAELLVALAVLGLVTGVVVRTVTTTTRLAAAQLQVVEVNNTLRATALILAEELRPLDPAAGDLVTISPGEITYRAVRSLYVVCRTSRSSDGVVSLHRQHLGSRPVDPRVDSLLLYDDSSHGWLVADLVSAGPGRRCPGGEPSLDVRYDAPGGSPLPAPVVGAPVQGFEVAQARVYRDSRGRWWLGMRRRRKDRPSWPATQPVIGPFAAHGLEFRFLGSDGRPTTNARRIVRIDVIVRAVSSDDAHREVGEVLVSVAPRNNPRR